MREKKIAIIGAGITGLSAAHSLLKQGFDVEIYEKSDRAGGVMQTLHEPYFFEHGPRTFQAGRCPDLLKLISDVGLSHDIIYTSPKTRYIYDGKLKRFPAHLALFPLLFEPFKKKGPEDESVWDFAKRRFGKRVADSLIDPMVKGIYAGDPKKLSIKHCFPALKTLEGRFLTFPFGPKKDHRLFTLKSGMSTLVDRLSKNVIFNTAKTPDELDADLILDARGPSDIPTVSLDVTHVVFETPVLQQKGFGFLVPTSQNSHILGTLFDSEVFPEQNKGAETRLSIMHQGGNPFRALEMLSISKTPIWTKTYSYPNAIAQYPVGFTPKRKEGRVIHIGPSVDGVAVNACVLSSKKYIESII